MIEIRAQEGKLHKNTSCNSLFLQVSLPHLFHSSKNRRRRRMKTITNPIHIYIYIYIFHSHETQLALPCPRAERRYTSMYKLADICVCVIVCVRRQKVEGNRNTNKKWNEFTAQYIAII
ncbi:hypothetical protein, unlikely [Trypanosoma brucei gambiense DAL972]|uniref:Uncharacterized protein n=1 Tax=Trypanosoma brucei gambiense (strain MHOM/CI/86/DAL972) TaxID=679716 RepID=D0A166_TRYB9|nr:hypothetical protein, unlikely [Trypanosoma brucei gambiense DAL972]CBH15008.1 hypothetical protein, unlikely [Trypanosoma brucei gambiense DAL972]|eukprot:XP_011777274.1 hypothetical protein, unlikely [Trypanosoma brucei gambiense DAL972]